MNKKLIPCNKPSRLTKGEAGYGKKKFKVKACSNGKEKLIKYGDANLSIKKHRPKRKKSYCARSSGQGNLNNKLSANYWSRKQWEC